MAREKIQELKNTIQELRDEINELTARKKQKETERLAAQGRLNWNSNMLWTKPNQIDTESFNAAIDGNKQRIKILSEQITKLDQQLKEANEELRKLSQQALPMAETIVTVFEDIQNKLEEEKKAAAPLTRRGLKK